MDFQTWLATWDLQRTAFPSITQLSAQFPLEAGQRLHIVLKPHLDSRDDRPPEQVGQFYPDYDYEMPICVVNEELVEPTVRSLNSAIWLLCELQDSDETQALSNLCHNFLMAADWTRQRSGLPSVFHWPTSRHMPNPNDTSYHQYFLNSPRSSVSTILEFWHTFGIRAANGDHYFRGMSECIVPEVRLQEVVLVAEVSSRGVPEPTIDDSTSRFRMVGEYWEIIYDGLEIHLLDRKGLRYLHHLLGKPNQDVGVMELETQADPPEKGSLLYQRTGRREEDGLDAVGFDTITDGPDAIATRRYLLELRELETEMETAKSNGDAASMERITRERDEIQKGLSTDSIGQADKARKRVYAALTAVSKVIRKDNRELGRFLQQSIRTGMQCSYQPLEEVHWEL